MSNDYLAKGIVSSQNCLIANIIWGAVLNRVQQGIFCPPSLLSFRNISKTNALIVANLSVPPSKYIIFVTSERSLFNITEKSQYEWPGPALPGLNRFWEAYISATTWPIHSRSFYRVTSALLQSILLFRYMWVTPKTRVTCKNEGVLVF